MNRGHHSPIEPYLGIYGRLIKTICEDIPDFPRVPKYVREGAKKIIELVLKHYTTQGRRRIAIVVAALGIARGNRNVSEIQDLVERVKYLTGEEIPRGQVRNTFKDLHTFLRLLPLYKSNRRDNPKLTPQEKVVLKILKAKSLR